MSIARATVTFTSQDDAIQGVVILEQEHFDAPVTIRGDVSGLTPGKHGFAIHVLGDISQNGTRVGGHFNPFGKNHGAPTDDERHVGSLGNIEANQEGRAVIKIEDRLVKLIGPQSVIGRSLIITKREDDLGKGGHESSLRDGNAGEPVAWGVVGITM
jgi:Cu-Zn family superoxide dismutase